MKLNGSFDQFRIAAHGYFQKIQLNPLVEEMSQNYISLPLVDYIVNNRVPLVTEQDGRACIEIVEAAYNAANKGITVKLP
jgi:hypothetical protein